MSSSGWWRLGLLVLLCWTGREHRVHGFSVQRARRAPVDADTKCDVTRYLPGNATRRHDDVDAPLRGSICNGRCCDRDTEEQLRQQAKEDFHSQIHDHSVSLLGLLATTADTLRETVTVLARQSENKTLTLFNQVYRAMAAQSKPSITSLYQAMVDYVSPANTAESLQQPLSQEQLHERFADFFTKLFPIAYHRAVNPTQAHQDFTESFKSCLYRTMDEIEPFGDVPKQIGHSLGKSLEATRVLIQALTLGKSVLEKTDGLVVSGTSGQQDACYKALLRMIHCPKCRAVPSEVKPCRGFCTNVMRGCLTEPVSELDFAWSEYVETVERLVVAVDGHNDHNDPLALNVERAVRHLDSRISDAVMHAMEKGPALEEKVRQICGRPELEPTAILGPQLAVPATRPSGIGGPLLGLDGRSLGPVYTPPVTPRTTNTLDAQLGDFLASASRLRSFYGTLSETICEEYPSKSCWNGERVGEYAKTVVDSSLISQRYNPEFTFQAGGPGAGNKGYPSANTSVLIDQLRHISQLVQAQTMSAPDPGVLLADEALEGSGSGDRPLYGRRPDDDEDAEDAEDDDRDDGEASGSGSGPSIIDQITPDTGEIESKGAGSRLGLNLGLAVLTLVLALAADV
ncbi:division abnormally delayed protein [Copidosoma floridanum]|uniref:division abnormally delayed protein n=1 Tax=Copidosoma floridanum TaxID=29053 RepID=UPI000C6F4CD3|nr:division abnormally delayed protein [Copidosoma floridanum]